jgi:hypothetical protein
MTINLPNLTLVTIDTEEHKLTRLALDDTLRLIQPAEVLIIADDFKDYYMLDAPIVTIIPAEEKLTTKEIYKALWYIVPNYVQTSHILTIQWDGWVIDETKWDDNFLDYDYIGAPWPWHSHWRVGNGGFSLRSMKLLKTLYNNQKSFPFKLPSDDTICRLYRPWLEDRGLKFAPEELAWNFSREHKPWGSSSSFGFHDPRNFNSILTPEQLEVRLDLAGPYAKKKFLELGVIK